MPRDLRDSPMKIVRIQQLVLISLLVLVAAMLAMTHALVLVPLFAVLGVMIACMPDN